MVKVYPKGPGVLHGAPIVPTRAQESFRTSRSHLRSPASAERVCTSVHTRTFGRLAARSPVIKKPAVSSWFLDAPERIRTSDLRFRRPTLYPAELRAPGGRF
jgi:hypothetical protein